MRRLNVSDEGSHASVPTPSTVTGVVVRIWDAGVPRFKRWRERRRPERRVSILLDSASIQISSPDTGSADFHVRVANFTRRPLRLDRVAIRGWMVGTRGLPRQTGFVQAHGEIAAAAVDDGWFAVTLQSADVRAVCEGIEPSPNLKSSPRARLWIDGTCTFKLGARDLHVPFRFERDPIGLYIPDRFAEC